MKLSFSTVASEIPTEGYGPGTEEVMEDQLLAAFQTCLAVRCLLGVLACAHIEVLKVRFFYSSLYHHEAGELKRVTTRVWAKFSCVLNVGGDKHLIEESLQTPAPEGKSAEEAAARIVEFIRREAQKVLVSRTRVDYDFETALRYIQATTL